jgi:hypothetical protein
VNSCGWPFTNNEKQQ